MTSHESLNITEIPDQTVEVIRQRCPDHGSFYADNIVFTIRAQQMALEGKNYEEIILELGPESERAVRSYDAAQLLVDEFNQGLLPRAASLLKSRKTSAVKPFVDEVSEGLLANLNFEGEDPLLPDNEMVKYATIFFACGVVRASASISSKDRDAVFESSVVNQFANALLARADKTLLCEKLAYGTADAARAQAQEMMPFIRQISGRNIPPEFIANKLLSQALNTFQVKDFHERKDMIAESDLTSAETAELGRNNTEMAKYIQKIRKYGVKSLIFPFGEVIPGHDAVYHDFSEYDFSVPGEQPLAVVTVVRQDADDLDKISTPKVDGMIATVSTPQSNIVLDSNGDLYLGFGISNNSVSLRTLFEYDGAAGKYEELREAILARLFDAVAPAKVVDRIEAESKYVAGDDQTRSAGAPQNTTNREAGAEVRNEPTRIIGRKVLPRIQYMRERSMGQVGKEFKAALAAEEAEQKALEAQQESQQEKSYTPKKKHSCPGFLRDLPKGAKGPGRQAIANAKAERGEDYEIPPGKTFVKSHDRGLRSKTEIVGHYAITSNTPKEAN